MQNLYLSKFSLALLFSLLGLFLPYDAIASTFTTFSFHPAVQPQRLAASTSALNRLSKYDVVVVIDKSRSMSYEDCQPDERAGSSDLHISRWEWCRRQLVDFSRKTAGVLPDGLRLVLFSSTVTAYENVNAKSVEAAFVENHPDGATKAAQAVQSELTRYFNDKSAAAPTSEAKPLMMIVITDGCPSEPSTLYYHIVDATNKMTSPEEITITFLQVGHDSRAVQFLYSLQNGRICARAKHPIIRTKSFDQLVQTGLTSAIIEAVSRPALSATKL